MDELTGPISPHRLSKSVFPRALRNTFLPQPICGYFAAGRPLLNPNLRYHSIRASDFIQIQWKFHNWARHNSPQWIRSICFNARSRLATAWILPRVCNQGMRLSEMRVASLDRWNTTVLSPNGIGKYNTTSKYLNADLFDRFWTEHCSREFQNRVLSETVGG